MSGISAEQTVGIFYKTRVRDVMTTAAVTCTEDVHVGEMARLMKSHNAGSVVVVDGEDHPLGIVTERDMVYKVVATDAGDLTAGEVMSSPPVTIDPDDFIYQAISLMTRHRCRRLIAVHETGEIAGFISMRDLMRLQAYDHRIIMERVAKAKTVDQLRDIRPEIDDFVHRLFLADVDGPALAEILTDFNDAVSQRIIFMAERRLRAEDVRPPLRSFAWITFGSEGRQEQVLRGDQDNGIIIEDGEDIERAKTYYRELATRVNDDMASYGFDLCDGGVMAREDKYFGTLSDWKRRATRLIEGSGDGQRLRDLTIVLDMRNLTGDGSLAAALWEHIFETIDRHPPVLRALAEDATTKGVPLNFLGRFRYEKDEEGRRGINIKKFGLLPLTAGIKALAIEHRIEATSSPERIAGLEARGVLERNSAADLRFAHELFLRLKLQTSIETVFNQQASSHFFYPEDWTDLERSNLRRAFRAVEYLLSMLRVRYSL
jgi:CBS domain-containing protein